MIKTARSDMYRYSRIEVPVAIDTHTHGRWNEYAQEHIGPLETILEAQAGGVGTCCFMPNTKPGLTTIKNVEQYTKVLEDAKLGNQYLYVGLRDDNLDQVEEALKLPNVVGIKVYPASAEGKSITTSFDNDAPAVIDNSVGANTTIDKAIRLALQYDKVISFHAESPQYGHIPTAEIAYVEYVIIPYAKKYPQAKIIVAHVSLARTAKEIEYTNDIYDTNIHMELTPHHLFFSEEDVQNDPKLKCFPPLRSKEDAEYLRGLLGQIDEKNRAGLKIMFGSDNAAHAKRNKDKPFDQASGGIPNLRDSIAIILSLGEGQKMTYDQLVQFTSGTASRLLNIPISQQKVFFQKGSHIPTHTYYNGNVYNPFQDSILHYRKV